MPATESQSHQFQRIASYYDKLVARYGHDPKACDYGQASSQIIKFRILSEVMDLKGRRLLDVGCGFADFRSYLLERVGDVCYSGVDLSGEMVQRARRLHPHTDVRQCNILADAVEGGYDVVTANGIFYLLRGKAFEVMCELIRRMFDLADAAVAFNSLSAWAPQQEPEEFYAEPLEVLRFCKTLTPWVTLRHDYVPHDFTMYLYKRQNRP
jgi:SAM-dependent methyltransferase